MSEDGVEQQLCPCYKESVEFQKFDNDTGLVVYRYPTRRSDVTNSGVIGSSSSTSYEVLRTRDVKLATSNLAPALERKDISCPRCRTLFDRVQKLVQNVQSIDKHNLLGVCDHCRIKALSKKLCYECEDAINKFVAIKQHENTKKNIKIWLSKMKHLFKDESMHNRERKSISRRFSDINLDRIRQFSDRSIRELEVKQLYSDIHKSDTDLYTTRNDTNKQHVLEKSVLFTEYVEPVDSPYNGSILGQGPMFFASDTDVYYDESARNIKGAMKKKHDLNLRQMMRPEIFEIPKIAPWDIKALEEHGVNIAKYYGESPMDTKGAKENITPKRLSSPVNDNEDSLSVSFLNKVSRRKHNLDDDSKMDVKAKTKKKTDHTPKSEMVQKKDSGDSKNYAYSKAKKEAKKERPDLSDAEVKLHQNIPKFTHEKEMPELLQKSSIKSKKKSVISKKSDILKKQFTYYFPKASEKESKKPKLMEPSSQLIKSTKAKLREHAEEEKKKKEEKRLKLEEKKQEAEGKKQDAERKKQEAEGKKQEAEGKKQEAEGKKQEAEGKKKFGGDEKKQGQLHTADEDLEKTKKELKSKERAKDIADKVPEKAKSDMKSKPGAKDLVNEFPEKGKMSKSGAKDIVDELPEKAKKDMTSKPGAKDLVDELPEKDKKSKSPGAKDIADKLSEEAKKDMKSKPGAKDLVDEVPEKGKISKSGAKNIADELVETTKKDIKSKPGTKDLVDELPEKDKKSKSPGAKDIADKLSEEAKKDMKSKPGAKDLVDEFPEKDKKSKSPGAKDIANKLSEEAKKDMKSKPGAKDLVDEFPEKDKKSKSPGAKDIADKLSEEAKKDMKSKPGAKDLVDEFPEKDKKSKSSGAKDIANKLSEEAKKDMKSKPGAKDLVDEFPEKDKKSKSPGAKDIANKLSEEAKKDMKSKPGAKDLVDEFPEKDKKSKSPGAKDIANKLSEEAKKDMKSKPGAKDLVDEFPEKDKKSKSPDAKDIANKLSEEAKKDMKSKPGAKDLVDEFPEKDKKSKSPGAKDIANKLSEEAKKDMKSKPGAKDLVDEFPEKDKKSKSGAKDIADKLSEEAKKYMKSKPGAKDLVDKVPEKDKKSKSGAKDTADELSDKAKKDMKSKPGAKDLVDELPEKDKKFKSKDIADELPERDKKDMKSKPGEKDFVDELPEKDKKSKSGAKDITDKLSKSEAKSLKDAEKEEKQRLKQIEDIKKRDKASMKKPDALKVYTPTQTKEKRGTQTEEISGEIIEAIPKKKRESKEFAKKEGPQDGEKSKKTKESSEDTRAHEREYAKLRSDLEKERAEGLKLKAKQESEETKARELADKKTKEALKPKEFKEAKPDIKAEPLQLHKIPKEVEKKEIEVKMNQVKMLKESNDSLILRLVKIRQTADGQRKVLPSEIDMKKFKAHQNQFEHSRSTCEICKLSDLEFDIASIEYMLKKERDHELEKIIIGENIYTFKSPHVDKIEEEEVAPLLFKSDYQEEIVQEPIVGIEIPIPEIPDDTLTAKDVKEVDQDPGKGIIRYALSDRTFIEKGWTMLPTEKVVRKMNVYRMRPAHPEFDWFENNKNKRLMTYDSGEKLAEFDDNGRGRWYYRNGRLAMDYYDAEETNAQQRFVIYSSGEPDERGRTHPITILATFDYLGNGIVFDHAGKIRLKYNQTEGVVLDRGIGPVSHWKWHTLNDPPVLQQVMIDTQMSHKDPQIIKLGSSTDTKTRPDNEEMLAIEFDNFIKEKSKKLSQKFKPFQIKMKALKINEHFSLKVLDQATIYLIFRDGSTNLKLSLGMILDHQEIVDTDTAEVGEVSNNLERFPARTDSLAGLQRSVAYAQRYERQRTERERRLRRPEPCTSADQLTAAASPPLRPPLQTLPTGSMSSSGYCKCRKPKNNLYYNTRLL